jgi:hypothetical protein
MSADLQDEAHAGGDPEQGVGGDPHGGGDADQGVGEDPQGDADQGAGDPPSSGMESTARVRVPDSVCLVDVGEGRDG